MSLKNLAQNLGRSTRAGVPRRVVKITPTPPIEIPGVSPVVVPAVEELTEMESGMIPGTEDVLAKHGLGELK